MSWVRLWVTCALAVGLLPVWSPAAASAWTQEGGRAALLPSAGGSAQDEQPLENVVAVAAGFQHTCLVTIDGEVRCWGYNSRGQLGDGTTDSRYTPLPVSGLDDAVTAISAGYAHVCALTRAGGVWCWGSNEYGQLGDGSTVNRPMPVEVSGLSGAVVAVSAGDGHSCAVTDAGRVQCWGRNDRGQLGDGAQENRLSPVDVVDLTGAAAVAAGSRHTCALTEAGGVKCWGSNSRGQLGDGSTTSHALPVDVVELSGGVVDVAAGYQHSCAVTEEGGVWCWGENEEGRLGNGTAEDNPVPVQVEGLGGVSTAIVLGSFASAEHACVLSSDGRVRCWGNNDNGQLGDGTTESQSTPVKVLDTGGQDLLFGATAIAAGGFHTCAVMETGHLKCWGRGGTIGDGGYQDSPLPVDVVGIPSAPAAPTETGAGPAAPVSPAPQRTEPLATSAPLPTAGLRPTAAAGWQELAGDDVSLQLPAGFVGGSTATELDTILAALQGLVGSDARRVTTLLEQNASMFAFFAVDTTVPDPRPQAYVLTTVAVAKQAVPRSMGVDSYLDLAADQLPADFRVVERDTVSLDGQEAGRLFIEATLMGLEARELVYAVRGDGVIWVVTFSTGADELAGRLPSFERSMRSFSFPVAPAVEEEEPAAGAGFRPSGPLVPELTTYIPSPLDVSTDPVVVGTNLFLAGLAMILFGAASALLNNTLERHEEALQGFFRPARWLGRVLRRLEGAVATGSGRPAAWNAVKLVLILLLYGIVFSLLEPGWDPSSVSGAFLFISMAVVCGLVGMFDDIAQWCTAHRWGVPTSLGVRPANLLLAIASTACSRLFGIVPGIMMGTPEAFEVDEAEIDRRRQLRLAGIGAGTIVGIGLGAWLLTALTAHVIGLGLPEWVAVPLGGVQSLLLLVFAVSVENAFLKMLGLPDSYGRVLRRGNRWLWGAGLLAITFLFYHTLINPEGDLAAALESTNVRVFFITVGAFVLFAVGLWLVFRLRDRRLAAS